MDPMAIEMSGHQTRGVRCLELLRDFTWHGTAPAKPAELAEPPVVSGGEDGGVKLWPLAEVERKRCLVEVEQWFSKPWLRCKKMGIDGFHLFFFFRTGDQESALFALLFAHSLFWHALTGKKRNKWQDSTLCILPLGRAELKNKKPKDQKTKKKQKTRKPRRPTRPDFPWHRVSFFFKKLFWPKNAVFKTNIPFWISNLPLGQCSVFFAGTISKQNMKYSLKSCTMPFEGVQCAFPDVQPSFQRSSTPFRTLNISAK